MRERRSGLIVYVSSVVGRLTFPLGGVYASSKWALEALAETSSYELAAVGIDVAIVQPGAFATEIGTKIAPADDTARAESYGDVGKKLFAEMEIFGTASQGRDPADVARAIVHLANLPAGMRPLRTTVPIDQSVESLNEAAVPIQAGLLKAMGLEDLLPKVAVV